MRRFSEYVTTGDELNFLIEVAAILAHKTSTNVSPMINELLKIKNPLGTHGQADC
jgi:hypothetical protein